VYAAYATLDDNSKQKKYVLDADKGAIQDDVAPYAQNTWNSGRPGAEGDAYWLGFTSTFTFFDPFTLKLSAAYGEFNAANKGDKNENGWNVQVKGSYALPFGTAVLGGWYFSGNDEDGKGYMPNAGYFAGTNHIYDGYTSLTNPSFTNNFGTWAVQAGIEGVSFLENLTHDFHVTYMEGTNDKKNATKAGFTVSPDYMTTEDSAVSFDFINTYQIYKHLTACKNLEGYNRLFNLVKCVKHNISVTGNNLADKALVLACDKSALLAFTTAAKIVHTCHIEIDVPVFSFALFYDFGIVCAKTEFYVKGA